MTKKIIGRREEKKLLKSRFISKEAEFMQVTGNPNAHLANLILLYTRLIFKLKVLRNSSLAF